MKPNEIAQHFGLSEQEAQEAAQKGPQRAAQDLGVSEDALRDAMPQKAPEAVVVDVLSGTVEEILAWVGDDVDRALRASDVEQERSKPRVTLLTALTDIIEAS